METATDTDEALLYDRAYLAHRRRYKRASERLLWMIVGAMLAIMLVMAMLGGGTPPADAGTPTQPEARVVCKPTCQLNRRLAKVCPSQPGAMERSLCIRWVQLGQCETGGQQYTVTLASIQQIRWRYDGPSGFDGALQFKPSTWTSNVARIPARRLTRPERLARDRGRYHHAWAAPPSVQILAAETLRGREGLDPWPHCRAWF